MDTVKQKINSTKNTANLFNTVKAQNIEKYCKGKQMKTLQKQTKAKKTTH